MERVVETVKNVVAVNLRYTSLLLGLAKDYIKSFESAVREGVAAKGAASGDEDTAPVPPRRPPILLVGGVGQEATGAFALNNSSDKQLNISLIVQGELDSAQVELVPSSVRLEPGASTIVRLKVRLGEAFQEERDYVGAVTAPGLSVQVVEFIVRRLASETNTSAAGGKNPFNAAHADEKV